ncbi:MAG TPA: von Willebrand factor type A domain-containing protein [Hanamia sp.]|nr:von Willebrand factor type A domain-containing protein [Hanamia sp.]
MKKIILLLLPLFLSITSFDSAKEIVISGRVTDSSGNPVNASVHAGKVYAVTDAGGYYHISINENEIFLIFSAVGFAEQKIKIGARKTIDVKMKSSSSNLHEVEVVGYGTMKSSIDVTNSPSLLTKKQYGIVSSPYSLDKNYERNDYNTEGYDNIVENGFKKVSDDPLSTFSIDVDAASYSNVRRFLQNNQLPPSGAVRTEEMINYFKYQYPQPKGKDPFSINTEISDSPWNSQTKLLLIGLQGKTIPVENLPPSNLVFLIDVSGSMMGDNRLPLVKASMKMLTDQLRESDRISIVVYAGQAGLVLPATSGNDKIKIKTAIDALQAGGSTAGGAGIQLAYATALKNFMSKGNNRVILCTDGDFNVGASSDDEMVRLIEKERNKGIFLTVLGYGMGNYKDNKMQQLADKGNGNHAYIDGLGEAKKVLINEFGGTLFTIAKDVKLQLEFNPAMVAGYRLIGYENRMLDKEDFNDDKKDAGELGSGHTVTALYEILPAGVKSPFLKDVDPLKYQSGKRIKVKSMGDELVTIKFRYKSPDSDKSELIVHPVTDESIAFKNASDNFRFAASVAGFAMLLRDSEYKGISSYDEVLRIANASVGKDEEGYRKEFVSLAKKAAELINDLVKREDD